MSYQLTTLDNGLRIASDPMPHMQSVAIAISVDVGARWESPAQHGLSHLLEHMAFKGTKHRTALEIAEAFDAIGGQFNAFTSHEHTVYYARVLSEQWQVAADILSDVMCHSLFDAAELEREKQVILQELAMTQDTPDDLVFDVYQEAVFGDQPLGRSILGSAESIVAQQQEDLFAFVQQHYQPQRMVISATGNIEHDALVSQMATAFDAWPQTELQTMSPAQYRGGTQLQSKALEQLQLVLGVESVPFDHSDYYAIQLLAILFGGGMSSRLFQEVREKRGLAYMVQAMNASYADCGVFSLYAATSAEQAAELLELMSAQWQKLSPSITEAELERAKQQQIASIRMLGESTCSVAEWMGRHLLQFGEYRDLDALTARLQSVTLPQIQQAAAKLLHQANPTLVTLGPQPQGLAVPHLAA